MGPIVLQPKTLILTYKPCAQCNVNNKVLFDQFNTYTNKLAYVLLIGGNSVVTRYTLKSCSYTYLVYRLPSRLFTGS